MTNLLTDLLEIAQDVPRGAKDAITTAIQEIERLQTKLSAYRPPYSEAQLKLFDDSCWSPPPQYVKWRHLPEVPEIPPGLDFITVWGCRKEYDIDQDVDYEFCALVDWCGDTFRPYGDTDDLEVRAWHYLAQSAPPKPEGEAPALILPVVDGEPTKCPECGGLRIVPAFCQVSIFDLDSQVLEDLGIDKPGVWDREIESEHHIAVYWCADCKNTFDSWIESNMWEAKCQE